jgi:hypothetical protein
MNCCDANGDCRQGKDCPIRKAKELLDGKPPASKQVTWALWAFIVLMLGLMTLRSCL